MQMAGVWGTVIAHKETLPIETVLRAKNWESNIRLSDINSQEQWPCHKRSYNYYSIYKDELIEKHIEKLADELLRHYNINSEVNWCWYEDYDLC
jgi:hypothetical protein